MKTLSGRKNVNIFLIGNKKTNINEKNKEEYMSFMMMNNKKNIKQRAKKRGKSGNYYKRKHKLRERRINMIRLQRGTRINQRM